MNINIEKNTTRDVLLYFINFLAMSVSLESGNKLISKPSIQLLVHMTLNSKTIPVGNKELRGFVDMKTVKSYAESKNISKSALSLHLRELKENKFISLNPLNLKTGRVINNMLYSFKENLIKDDKQTATFKITKRS